MAATFAATTPVPVLEPAAKRLAEQTDPHPRIYEMPPGQSSSCAVCRRPW
jgi:hypothetical protein